MATLLEKLLDGAAEIVKRPFTERAIKRAFESATDSLDSQLDDADRALMSERENLVKTAQTGGELKYAVQKLIDLQQSKLALQQAKDALAAEKKAFLE